MTLTEVGIDLSWDSTEEIPCEGFDYKAYNCTNAAVWVIDAEGCDIDPKSWLCDECFSHMTEVWEEYMVECEHGREVIIVRVERIKT